MLLWIPLFLLGLLLLLGLLALRVLLLSKLLLIIVLVGHRQRGIDRRLLLWLLRLLAWLIQEAR